MTVLILARELDASADRMVQALGARGVPVFRTDLAAFPQELTLDAKLTDQGWEGVLATAHRQVQLNEIRSVWYRHPSHFVLPEGMSGPERRHAAAEARWAGRGAVQPERALGELSGAGIRCAQTTPAPCRPSMRAAGA